MVDRAIHYKDSRINANHGLLIFDDVCDHDEEVELLKIVDGLEHGASKREYVNTRTTMHLGHVFNPTTLKLDHQDQTVEIPKQLRDNLDRIFEKINIGDDHLSNFDYDQITINRYHENIKNGIGSHVDTHSVFTDKIISLSLGAPTVMRFELPDFPESSKLPELYDLLKPDMEKFKDLPKRSDIWIKPRSLIVMTGMARYLFKHKIPVRKTDIDPDGNVLNRSTRTSITVRKIRFDGICNCDYPVTCDYQNPESLVLPSRIKIKSKLNSYISDVSEVSNKSIRISDTLRSSNGSHFLDFEYVQDKGITYFNSLSKSSNDSSNNSSKQTEEFDSFQTVEIVSPLILSFPVTNIPK